MELGSTQLCRLKCISRNIHQFCAGSTIGGDTAHHGRLRMTPDLLKVHSNIPSPPHTHIHLYLYMHVCVQTNVCIYKTHYTE